MASVVKRGSSYLVRCRMGDQRIGITVKGKQRSAERVGAKIDELIDVAKNGVLTPTHLVEWLDTIDPTLHTKLAEAGLTAPRPESLTLGQLFDRYIADRRVDVSTSRVIKYEACRKLVERHFGKDCQISSISRARAIAFIRWMREQKPRQGSAGDKLSENYVRGTIAILKAMFNWAADVERRFAASNPFAGQSSSLINSDARRFFVSHDDINKVLSVIPDCQWRLLVALGRYGGLRLPSEAIELKWTDVLFDQDVFVVRSPKTEGFESGVRRVPVFPELRPYFTDCWEAAVDGAVHPIMFTRDPEANLRTQFCRFIALAGVKQWPKPFQNLRSSRETELLGTYAIHVVASWMGHSPNVALKHYAQVQQSDIAAATGRNQQIKWADNCCPTCGQFVPSEAP